MIRSTHKYPPCGPHQITPINTAETSASQLLLSLSFQTRYVVLFEQSCLILNIQCGYYLLLIIWLVFPSQPEQWNPVQFWFCSCCWGHAGRAPIVSMIWLKLWASLGNIKEMLYWVDVFTVLAQGQLCKKVDFWFSFQTKSYVSVFGRLVMKLKNPFCY